MEEFIFEAEVRKWAGPVGILKDYKTNVLGDSCRVEYLSPFVRCNDLTERDSCVVDDTGARFNSNRSCSAILQNIVLQNFNLLVTVYSPQSIILYEVVFASGKKITLNQKYNSVKYNYVVCIFRIFIFDILDIQ